MIIIADSGSTKTQWLIISDNKQSEIIFSEGINPYFLDVDEIRSIVKDCFSSFDIAEVEKVFFYGAGCALAEKCAIVSSALSMEFSKASIQVASDLLASAHALFGSKQGVACILGTGSNAAVYDGANFTDKIQSVGYLLGDEGSGSYIGRQLLQAYLRKEMPKQLMHDFSEMFSLDRSVVLDHVYKKPFPNRYLASFTSFASEHYQSAFIQDTIRSSFHDFIKYQLNTLSFDKDLPVGFVGSIAFYFQDILRNELEIAHYNTGQILKEPIHNLMEYYGAE